VSPPWPGFESPDAEFFVLEVALKGSVPDACVVRRDVPEIAPDLMYALGDLPELLGVPEETVAATLGPRAAAGADGRPCVSGYDVSQFVSGRRRQAEEYTLLARCFATARLGISGLPAANQALMGLLAGDPHWEVRSSAATGLGRRDGPDVVAALVAALQDPSTEVRGTSARALGNVGDASAVQSLAAALRDGSTRREAIEALGMLGGPEATETLVGILRGPPSPLRHEAAMALGEIGGEAAVSALLEALRDEQKGLRVTAAFTLGRLRPASALEPLMALLADPEHEVRASAANALGNPGAIPHLIHALKFDHGEAHHAIYRALHRLTGQRFAADDPESWRAWWEQNKARLLPAEPPGPQEQPRTQTE